MFFYTFRKLSYCDDVHWRVMLFSRSLSFNSIRYFYCTYLQLHTPALRCFPIALTSATVLRTRFYYLSFYRLLIVRYFFFYELLVYLKLSTCLISKLGITIRVCAPEFRNGETRSVLVPNGCWQKTGV